MPHLRFWSGEHDKIEYFFSTNLFTNYLRFYQDIIADVESFFSFLYGKTVVESSLK